MPNFKRPHDLGGDPASAIEREEKASVAWEKRTDAILRLVSHPSRRLMTVDELRRSVEDLGPGQYETLSYYERWISAITAILTEKGTFSVTELAEAMGAVEREWQAAGRRPADGEAGPP